MTDLHGQLTRRRRCRRGTLALVVVVVAAVAAGGWWWITLVDRAVAEQSLGRRSAERFVEPGSASFLRVIDGLGDAEVSVAPGPVTIDDTRAAGDLEVVWTFPSDFE